MVFCASASADVLGSSVGANAQTQITGDVYSAPGDVAVNGPVTGTTHQNDAAATSRVEDARNAIASRFNTAASSTRSGDELGNGEVFGAGTVHSASTMAFAGTTTLRGNANDVVVFRAQQTMSFQPGSRIVLDGIQACHVFFVGRSAVQVKSSQVVGNITALRDIIVTGSSVAGDLAATDGRVGVTDGKLSTVSCAPPPPAPTCQDGSTPNANGGCPVKTKVCSLDGSPVPEGQDCPVIEARPIPAGNAKMSMPRHCVTRAFTVKVTGKYIRSATLWVGGKRIKRQSATNSGTRIQFHLDGRDFSTRSHTVKTVIRMENNRVIKLTSKRNAGVRRCAPRKLRPHPAG